MTKTLETLRAQAWMDYGTSSDNRKKLLIASAASPAFPAPLWIAAASAAPDSALAITLTMLTMLSVLASMAGVIYILTNEIDDRGIIKSHLDKHVRDSLDGNNQELTFSKRLKADTVYTEGYQWESLSPAHLRWIEMVYQRKLKDEAERRALKKQVDKGQNSVISTLDTICAYDSASVNKVKSFLDGMDKVLDEEKMALVTKNPTQYQLDQFDAQMKKVASH